MSADGTPGVGQIGSTVPGEGGRHDEVHGLPRLLVARRRMFILVPVAGLVLIGSALLIAKVAGFTKVVDKLRDADPRWLAVCFGAEVVSYVGYILALQGTARARRGPRLPLWVSTRVVFTSLAATRIAAAGGAGGLAVDYWALRRAGLGPHEALVRILALNTLLYLAFGLAAAAAGALAIVHLAAGVPLAMSLPWVAVVGTCLLLAVLLSSPRGRPRADAGAGRVRRLFCDAVEGVVVVREMISGPNGHRWALAGAPMYWFGDILCLWAALRGVGVSPPPPAIVLAYATGYLASLLPVPTGAEGGVEAAMTFALHAIGVPLEAGLVGVIGYRLFGFWLPTLPALATLPGLRGLARDLGRVAGPVAAAG